MCDASAAARKYVRARTCGRARAGSRAEDCGCAPAQAVLQVWAAQSPQVYVLPSNWDGFRFRAGSLRSHGLISSGLGFFHVCVSLERQCWEKLRPFTPPPAPRPCGTPGVIN